MVRLERDLSTWLHVGSDQYREQPKNGPYLPLRGIRTPRPQDGQTLGAPLQAELRHLASPESTRMYPLLHLIHREA